MKKSILFICLLTLASTLAKVQAQEERNHGIIWSSLHGLEYGVKAGFNIGGTSPLPLPQEIELSLDIVRMSVSQSKVMSPNGLIKIKSGE